MLREYIRVGSYLEKYIFMSFVASIFAWTRGLLHRAKLDGK